MSRRLRLSGKHVHAACLPHVPAVHVVVVMYDPLC